MSRNKSKISSISIILLLAISTIIIALPAVNAQTYDLIMNCGTTAIYGGPFDIDLNGPSEQLEGLKFAYIPPDGTEWIITTDPPIDNEPGLPGERYVTDPSGDCDIDWTPTDGMGDYQVKWVHPASGSESDVVTVTFGEAPRLNPYPYINAVPNPVQVDKPTLFHVGSIYPTRRDPGPNQQWSGLVVEIEDPNGDTITLPPVTTDSTGGTATQFTPTMVGTYKVRTHFPEQVKTFSDGFSGAAGTVMEDSYSDWLDLVVQQEPIAFYPTQGLPTEYWTRPIDGQIREWYTIASPWLENGEPTSTGPTSMNAEGNEFAPETGHILHRFPIAMGGLAGGLTTWEHGFEQGDAYEGKWNGATIIGGVLYYNQFQSGGGSDVEQIVAAVDLHTGEELWRRPLVDGEGNVRRLSFGQQFYFDGFNYHGVFGYLIATSGRDYHFFEPQSGRWLYTFEGVPSGTRFRGPNGEILIYSISQRQGTISLWNSQAAIAGTGVYAGSWLWGDEGTIFDDVAEDGLVWEITVPEMAEATGGVYKVRDGIIMGADFSRGSLQTDDVHMWCVAVDNDAGTADFLWEKTMAPMAPIISIEDVSCEEDLFIMSTKETRATYGFRLSTGEQLWGPTPTRDYHDIWGHASGNSWDIILEGYNKVIAGNYGGTVWCYNAETGDVEWHTDLVDPYTEILHNNRWRFRPSFYTDGKLYLENTEHNPRDPQPRGAPIWCLDIESGDILWQLPYRQGEWSSTLIIGDSIVVAQNTYDQHIYAIGTGPSKTTVEAPLTGIAQGQSVVIRGTVMDISPGTKEEKIALRFPNGVAAVSDDSQTMWMTYVYNQLAMQDDVEGVDVFVKVQDPNGEWYSDTVTTDSNGVFSLRWAPTIVGEYFVTAMFEGSKSYFGSQASTTFSVDAAPESPDYPTADEIAAESASRTIAMLPPYPDVPTQEAIADDAARRTIAMLPQYPTPYPPAEIPAYQTIDLVIIVLVVVVLVIGLYCCLMRKQK